MMAVTSTRCLDPGCLTFLPLHFFTKSGELLAKVFPWSWWFLHFIEFTCTQQIHA